MEKMYAILPMLINKHVLLGEQRGTITSFTDARFGCMQMEDGSVRRGHVDKIIEAFFAALRAERGAGAHENLKLLAVALLEQLQDHRNHKRDFNKRKKDIMRRRRALTTDLEATEEQARKAGRRRAELPSPESGHKQRIQVKLAAVDHELARLQTEARMILKAAPGFFNSRDELVKFFASRCLPGVSDRSLSRWAKGDSMGRPGRTMVFDEEAETLLVQTILRLDEAGVPMGQSEICSLAHSLALEGRSRFGQFGPTTKWYHAFVRRAKARDPHVMLALERGTDCKLLRWYNSKNITWWHGAYVRKILKYGFAQKTPEGSIEYRDGALDRIVLGDETCVSGGQTRKVKNGAKKIFSLEERLEKKITTKKHSYHRRLALGTAITEEHISLLLNVTLSGQVGPLAWIFSAKNDISDQSRRAVHEATGHCGGFREGHDLHPFCGRNIPETIIATSDKGGVTGANITPLMTRIIKSMYPDVAPEEGKRVLWLTDWHSSRMTSTFLDTMERMGVIFMGWLPNTTSKCQLADVIIFGDVKSKMERIEADWILHNPGKRVDRTKKVEFASKAVAQVVTRNKILEGARLTGVHPIDPKPLLENSACAEGDKLLAVVESSIGTDLLRLVQSSPSSSHSGGGSVASPESSCSQILHTCHCLVQTPPAATNRGDIDAEPHCVTSPMRSLQSSAHWSRLMECKTRLSDTRNLADHGDDEDPQILESARLRARSAALRMADDLEVALPDIVARVDRDRDEKINELRREEQRIHERALATKDGRRQELSMYRLIVEELAPSASAKTVAMAIQVIDDLAMASRDDMGIAAGELDDHPPKRARVEQALPERDDLNMGALRDAHVVASQHQNVRALKNHAKGACVTTKSKTLAFRAGSFMYQFGIEGTDEEYRSAVADHEKETAKQVAEKNKRIARSHEKKAQALADLPARLADAKAKVHAPPATSRIGDCRDYAKALLAKARQENDSARVKSLIDILSKPGGEIRTLVTALAHPAGTRSAGARHDGPNEVGPSTSGPQ